jgi:hypothetical protein
MMGYQVIVIDDYFGQAGTGYVDGVMGSLFRIKRDAYRTKLGAHVVPVAGDDHYCIHVAINDCATMSPVLVFKVVPFSRSMQHAQRFPFLELARGLYSAADFATLERHVHERIKRGLDVSYSGGWAIMPGARRSRRHSEELKNMYTGLHFLVHEAFGLDSMTGFGAVEQGTYDFAVREWGAVSPVAAEVRVPFYNNDRCRAVSLDMLHASEHKIEMADKYRPLWERRVHFACSVGWEQRMQSSAAG